MRSVLLRSRLRRTLFPAAVSGHRGRRSGWGGRRRPAAHPGLAL